MPKVYNPNVANRLNPMGSGLPDLMARGIELPARIIEARRANSTPYALRFWMRRPPRMYNRPTVTPAAIEGMDPVRI